VIWRCAIDEYTRNFPWQPQIQVVSLATLRIPKTPLCTRYAPGVTACAGNLRSDANVVPKRKKMQIGDHALPQRGFGLGTPEGAETGGVTPGNTRPGRQQERAQATMHQTSSKHTSASRHGRISNRSPNQKDIAGKNRADSSTNRAGKSGQEAERVKKPRHANPTDIHRAERVYMQCLAHPRSRDSVTRQEIQEIKPQISRIRAVRRGSLAAEEEMLDAAPAAFHKGVPPRSMQRRPSDADLAIGTRTEPMQRQGVPKHRVTERKVAREDTKEGVHKRSRKLQERHQVCAHGKGAAKRV
jgi:hypothetical protein